MDHFTRNEIDELLKKLKSHQYANIFMQPIEEVISSFPHYTSIISNPIDLGKIIN